MNNIRLTPKFTLEEFYRHKKIPTKVSTSQLYLIRKMANMLQIVRDEIVLSTINIQSGVRTLDDYDRLIRQGYYPSSTSDHFFGVGVPSRKAPTLAKFGAVYTYSVGAVDITTPFSNLKDVFVKIVALSEFDSNFNPRQVIYEKGKYSDWIHIANPLEVRFSDNYINAMSLENLDTKYMYSSDNGKSYKKFDLANPPLDFLV